MRKSLFFLWLLTASISHAQDFNDSLARSRNTITQEAMIALGSFAIANIASGFIVAGQTHGVAHFTWAMNGYWNLVNLGIATMGYLGAMRALHRTWTLAQNDRAQLSVEKTYVLNFGLDLVYITGGFYLNEKGNSESNPTSRDQYRGYGTSISIQGGFLLLLDATMIALHHHNSIRINRKLAGLSLRMAPMGVALCYSF